MPRVQPNSRFVRCLAAAALASPLGAAACSEDSTTKVAEPDGPPVLSISALLPTGGAKYTPGSSQCLELGKDPERTVTVVLSPVTNWTFESPENCLSTPQCGSVRVTVEPLGGAVDAGPGPFVRGATGRTIAVPMDALGATSATQFRFTVDLILDPDGVPFVGNDGGATTHVDVTLCAPLADGGTDGADGAVPPDGAVSDAGTPDGTTDSGSPDAAIDAGAGSDAGHLDGGGSDADAANLDADAANPDASTNDGAADASATPDGATDAGAG